MRQRIERARVTRHEVGQRQGVERQRAYGLIVIIITWSEILLGKQPKMLPPPLSAPAKATTSSCTTYRTMFVYHQQNSCPCMLTPHLHSSSTICVINTFNMLLTCFVQHTPAARENGVKQPG